MRAEKIGALLDYNQRLTTILRSQAKDWETIANAFDNAKEQCLNIAELAALQARTNSDLTGDIISTEFGIVEAEDIDDDDIDDEDWEDDEHD